MVDLGSYIFRVSLNVICCKRLIDRLLVKNVHTTVWARSFDPSANRELHELLVNLSVQQEVLFGDRLLAGAVHPTEPWYI